ncbi:MAG: hypothetical protein UY47_C0004G0042 [Parcubacteria group bacterium GW2011_GWB1_49_7]|nr:MAG: hypothetical protein UX71_C0002G0070 [Parcubacteria group bacterium GW2011_GWA1_47_10]KKW09868.1 MAG: hypothetical protein UY47_C0004G0042 [Parcubacteria group bacterium GW2011_GWB1_49_7]
MLVRSFSGGGSVIERFVERGDLWEYFGMEVEIFFDIEKEIERVADTLKRLPWYREQGYTSFHTNLPKQLTEQSNRAEIASAISAEFNEEKYRDYSEHIQKVWSEISQNLIKLKEIADFKLLQKYTIILTKYGSGGSYNSKQGVVIVNINFRSKEQIAGTITHEIIHIGIQHLVDQYKIKHWYKERLVDLICHHYFSDLRKMQDIKEDVSVVDKALEAYFPDIEAITKEIWEISI